MHYVITGVCVLWLLALADVVSAQDAPQAAEVVTRTSDNISDVRSYLDELAKAPESGSWGRDQGDIQFDLDQLLDDIIGIILGDQYQSARERLFALENKIDISNFKIDELRIARLDASPSPRELTMLDRALLRDYAPGSIEDIDARIAQLTERLAENITERDFIIFEFRGVLARDYSIEVSLNQARSVLYQINGSSIVEAMVTFAVLQQIETRFAEVRLTTSNDDVLRQYYGMAAALRLVVARLHERHYAQYSQDWIPAIDGLAVAQHALVAETEGALLDPSNAPRRDAYENNLAIQMQVNDVIDDYRDLLIERQEVVRARFAEAERDAALAVNTLKTLENAAILFDQFSWNSEEFEALMSIRNSDLIPLDDAQVTENYLDLSRQMQGS